MMHHEIYSWSHQYRQERLAEARMLRLEAKLRESREQRSVPRLGLGHRRIGGATPGPTRFGSLHQHSL